MKADYELLTDLYQLTMAQGYWATDKIDSYACFHMYFRDYPFKGGYAIACGLAQLAEIVDSFHFSETDLLYLSRLRAPGGGPMFDEKFLAFLRGFRLKCDIDAVSEGAARSGFGSDPFLPAARDGASELREFPNSHRDESRTCLPCCGGCTGCRVRVAPCTGPRRCLGVSCGDHRRMRLHEQCARGQALQRAGIGDACAFLGDVVRIGA